MKITIVEHVRSTKTRREEGKEIVEDVIEDTGREWTVDIPIEPVGLGEVWAGLRCDLYNLIETFRRARLE